MKVIVDAKTLMVLVGWILAGLASVALIAQHIRWTNQQSLWQQELTHQVERIVELELIIADLHLQKDERAASVDIADAKTNLEPISDKLAPAEKAGAAIKETAQKTGSVINSAFSRVRSTFKRDD
ncbi:hypothetical protein [Marinagarivorans algicola]|uniref:hypothetical protein n=1 Tax=Marinagarivorans algicola TaxID=1513270 RepID=UPI0006B3FAA7|nr:hypothetical protein [Marinagarivorans algicola]